MQKLIDKASVRWGVMIIVSFTMMCGYILTDVMAPMKEVLENELRWNSTDYGIFSGAYGYLNVFLLMIIFGGLILDKLGIRFTGLTSAMLMIIGAAIKYFAIDALPTTSEIFGINSQVFYASLGFAIFGVGCEIMNITVTKIIVKWFKGKEIALALGLQVAIARIGTIMALMFAMPIAEYFGIMEGGKLVDYNQSMPILMCLLFLCIGFVGFIGYTFFDKKLDKETNGALNEDGDEEKFKISDVKKVVTNKGFWLIAIICVFFYSAVFPFLKYASDLMVHKYNVEPELAGIIPSVLPFGTMVLTPLFGTLYDRIGYGASIMIFGSLLLVIVHLLFALPILNYWWFALILMFVLGAAFSLVPSAMWPSVPKIINDKELGTGYSLIFWVQNWGLMGFPLLIGFLLDKYCITSLALVDNRFVKVYDYTTPMLVFASLGVVSMLFAYWLKKEDRAKSYGLEAPNIKK
ncbi:MAG: MFS transporter [Bacteroidales bacterium]|nr:MFS transporter [Bacteroidales bacterium]MBR5532482.1 MFS transporter [Bacteroidales bacterium]